jgi:AMMECR1 domain-containing protein
VATEHRLGREQFLAETCVKAGLPREAWRETETKIFGFECEIIPAVRQPL